MGDRQKNRGREGGGANLVLQWLTVGRRAVQRMLEAEARLLLDFCLSH